MVGYDIALMCLALNIYHEADWRPQHADPREQMAIALVTVNRTKNRNLDICEVVFQSKQFSWTIGATDVRGELLPEWKPVKGRRWQESLQIARLVLSGSLPDFTGGADHYHATYIPAPPWGASTKLVGKWGRHVFYKLHRSPK